MVEERGCGGDVDDDVVMDDEGDDVGGGGIGSGWCLGGVWVVIMVEMWWN